MPVDLVAYQNINNGILTLKNLISIDIIKLYEFSSLCFNSTIVLVSSPESHTISIENN